MWERRRRGERAGWPFVGVLRTCAHALGLDLCGHQQGAKTEPDCEESESVGRKSEGDPLRRTACGCKSVGRVRPTRRRSF